MMEFIFYVYIFILWLLFWSFASVLIFRLRSWEKWIFFWRSKCWNCWKQLWFMQLIPVLSYLFYRWKCFNCNKKISWIYLFLELCMWFLFVFSLFLVDINLIFWLDFFEISKLVMFLIFAFVTVVFVFYDLLYMEIPESVLLFWNTLALLWILLFSWFWTAFFLLLLCVLFYMILLLELENKYDLLIIVWVLLFTYIAYFFWLNIDYSYVSAIFIWFLFFYLQILFSWWAWLWWWDLRIVIFMALILWKFMLFWLFFSYFFWSIISIFILLYLKIKWKDTKKIEVPFGPFLAIWLYFTLFFLSYIENDCNSCQIFIL